MQPIEQTYLRILRQPSNDPLPLSLSTEEQQQLLALALRHFTTPFILPYLTDTFCLLQAKNQTKNMMLQYQQVAHLTNLITSRLEAQQIPYVLLKGISLAQYYPLAEYRKLGDVDLYIADANAFTRTKQLLEASGFVRVEEISDHHLTYEYLFSKIGRSFTLELHFRVIGLYQFAPANHVIDEVYASERLSYHCQTIGDSTYRVLPPTEYTFYLIHHMLKHYLYGGFGIRLLYDFVCFLRYHHTQICFEQLHTWCKTSHIFHLYEVILESCRLYLGLSEDIDPRTHACPKDCETFLTKVLHDNDLGTVSAHTLVGSGSYKKITLFTYFKEFHLQMHVRFPKLGHFVLLWPCLWCITLFCFIKNTYFLRHTSLRETFRAFKKKNQETTQIKIFENSD